MTEKDWLGNNSLSLDIFNKKYRINNESFEEWLDRVSGGNSYVRQLIKDKKFLFGGRILASRGVTDRRVTYSNCFTGDTIIMTDKGLRSLISCCADTVPIKVLSNGTWREAKVQYFGDQEVKLLTLRRGKTIRQFRVTGNHQWFIRNKKGGTALKSTDELCIGDIIPTEVLKCYRAYKPNPIGVAHGFFMGDGDHVDKKSLRVNICKGKEELLPYFTPDTIGHSGDVITICGMPRFFLKYPSLEESKAYLYGWLAGYFAADGSVDLRGSCVICSTNKLDLKYVQNVLCVLGIPCEEIRQQTRISNLNGKKGTVFILNLNKKYLNENFFIRKEHRDRFIHNPFRKDADWKVDNLEELGSICPVYCAVVPDTQSFALEGGIKTHNCYVIKPPTDCIEDIFEAGKKLARTYSYGGGCGIDISNLRPKGAIVHNAAKSTSGAVSFMDFYSYVTGLIGQSGRRGALMISISCEHPDIEEFINLKTKQGVCEKANISIRVSDEFMQAAIDDRDWETSFTSRETGTITRTFKARDLLKLLAKRNWEWAEPGLLYWDRITGYNMLDNDGNFAYAGVNPCLTGDSLIQTVEGEISIKDLVGSTPFVYCMDSDGNLAIRKAIKVWKTRENAQLVEVIAGKGRLICTPDHRIFTTNRGWVEAANLQKGDKIKGLNRQTTGHKYCSVGLSGTKYEKEHRFIARHFYDIEDMDVHHINDNGFDNRLSNLEVITHEEHSKLSNTGRAIEVNRDETTGRYLPKEEHTGRTCRNLGREVGVNWYVQEVRTLDYTEDVYDMTVEDTHNFIANGFVVHNCAEEPLPAGGSCLLGSINLSEFVINPFTDKANIDWDGLEEAVSIAILGLNEVLNEGMMLHPLHEQRESVKNWRQIGLVA